MIVSPFSHLAHGLFQASPSVAQHWDFSVAPLMLTSQRLLTIFSQQVLLVVSVERSEARNYYLCRRGLVWYTILRVEMTH